MNNAQSADRETALFNALYTLSIKTRESCALAALLEEVVRQAAQLLNASGGGFYLAEVQQQQVRCVVSYQTQRDFRGVVLKYGEGVAGIVAQTGQGLIIDDYRLWEKRALQYEAEQPFRAVLSAPVIYGTPGQSQVVGVLHVLDTTPERRFTQDDLDLLSLFANQSSVVIENARLLEDAQQHQKQAETLRQTAATLTSSLNLNDVLDNILTLLRQAVYYDSATLFLCEKDALRAQAARKLPHPEIVVGKNFPLEDVLFTEIFQTRHTLILDDAQADARYHGWGRTHNTRSWMGIPLILKDAIIGILTCDHYQPGVYTTADAALAQAFSNQAAIAIENARLFEAERAQLVLARTLQEVGALLTSQLPQAEVLDNLLNLLKQVIDYDCAAIHLLGSTGRLYLAAQRGFSNPAEVSRVINEISDYLLERRWKTKKAIIIPNTNENPNWQITPETAQVQAWIGAPLLVKGVFIGSLNVDSYTANTYCEEDAQTVMAFADQAAIAIENARLYEQVATERRHLGLIFDISRELTRSLDPQQILDRAITLSCQALGGRMGQAFLYLPEEDRLSLRALYGKDAIEIQHYDSLLNLRPGKGLAGWVAQSRQSANVGDVMRDIHWLHVDGIDEDVKAALSTPVEAEGKLLGVMTVLSPQANAFEQTHIQLMQAICQEVGLALSNAQRYQQVQRRLAEITLIQILTLAFNQRLEVRELLDEVVTQLVEKLGYSQIAIFLIEGDYLVLKASHGLQTTTRAFPISSGISHRILHHGVSYFTPDVSEEADYAAWSDTPIISEIAVPIYQKGNLAGVVLVGSAERGRLTTQDCELLQVLAGQAAVALENAFLYETVHSHAAKLETIVAQRTAELSGVYQLSQEIGYSLSFDELIRLLLRHLQNAIECDLAGGCLEVEGSKLIKLQVRQPISEKALEGVRLAWTQMQVDAGENSLDADGISSADFPCEVIHSEDFDPEATQLEQVNSWAWAPIQINQKKVGALALGSIFPEAFGAAQERLLSTFANQASSAAQRLLLLLTAQQKQLESLVQYLSVGVLLLDHDFRLLVANPAGRKILQALGVSDTEKTLTRLGDFWIEELVEKRHSLAPLEITAQDGSKRVFAVQIGQAGAPGEEERRQWVLALSDITQERENMLRAQIQERLATVGQLAAGIAHDFNNIMAAILVYTDLLLYDPSISPANQDKLSIIQRQIQRASSLIRQILDFSRRSVMDQSELDLLPLIKELDKMLGRILPETIQVKLTYQPGVYWVNGDPARLQQVFMNLALNARDAMPEGGVLHFELSKVKFQPGSPRLIPDITDGDWVCITVSDTGVGIRPEDRAHIFEPFFTTKPVSQGTGLGLAQVYGIVRQHDGYIDVQSQVGEGSRFLIFLPMLRKSEITERPSEPRIKLAGQGQLLLIVEDDTVTRQALQTLLDAVGYRSLAAANGLEALKLLQENTPAVQLVISDIVMPQMGGIELYQVLQLHYPQIKMLLITGHPLDEINQKMLERGQVAWLQKPFTVQGLNQAIQNLLE